MSNYNGLTISARHQFSSLQVQANYTWSHALDEISNAGFLQYNFATNQSILTPQDPFNLRAFNYGNADYDSRHYFSLNYVWTTPKISGWKGVLADWTVSGTIFARSGLPFTVIDGNATGTLGANNFGGALNGAGAFVFANYLGGAPSSCGSEAVSTACLTSAMFSVRRHRVRKSATEPILRSEILRHGHVADEELPRTALGICEVQRRCTVL